MARPPSAVVTILTGWKLNTAMSDQRHEPIGSPPMARADAVRGILDHAEAVVLGKRPDRFLVGRAAAEMHRDDGLGQAAGRLGVAQLLRQRRHADVVGARIDVDEIDVGAAQPRAIGGGDEGVGHGPHHVARAGADGKARDVQRRGGAVHRDRMRHAAQLGERRFKPADRRALGQPVRPQRVDDGLDVGLVDPLPAVRDHAAASSKRRISATVRKCGLVPELYSKSSTTGFEVSPVALIA